MMGLVGGRLDMKGHSLVVGQRLAKALTRESHVLVETEVSGSS